MSLRLMHEALRGLRWLIAAMAVVACASGRLPARAAEPPGGKMPPGAVPAFAGALAHFDLEIPVADKSGVIKITTLTADPARSFAQKPGYGAFFWASGPQRMV